MKFVKGISLFFICPILLIAIGFGGGILVMHFFYPGNVQEQDSQKRMENIEDFSGKESEEYNTDYRKARESSAKDNDMADLQQGTGDEEEALWNVAAVEGTLNADTEYVVQERDLLRDTVVETTWQIPAKYIGMDRELFVESMEEYKLNPPLAEVERGFVGLEVLSFSPERVVVQMNYEYVQPSESFYLVVQDNEVVVLLEDMKTVFINTGIRLEELPESVQMKIIQMYWMEDEESLYDFLETYSS